MGMLAELPPNLPQREIIDTFFGVFRFLSNFHPCPAYYDGELYPSAEHAYQAAKTMDLDKRLKVAACITPKTAKHMGSWLQLRPNWESIKVGIMREVIESKFWDMDLAALLLATGDAVLIEENNWGDCYWGQVNGDGLNVLGNLLMEIREDLHESRQRRNK